MAATTFVPDAGTTITGYRKVYDLKSGARFSNVVWDYIQVFKNEGATGTAYNITPTSNYTNTIIRYDTDSTSYSYSGNSHTVSIYYDSTYK